MPPQPYCEPSYNVMSSLQGVKVTAVSPLNNNSLTITLQQLNTISNWTTNQKIVAVGGVGDTAGSNMVNPGWKTNTQVHLRLMGLGSIYNLTSMHSHLFPYTDRHYQIGYDDGCAGRVVEGHHTSDYKRGYADGQAACSGGRSSGGDNNIPRSIPNTRPQPLPYNIPSPICL